MAMTGISKVGGKKERAVGSSLALKFLSWLDTNKTLYESGRA